MAGRLCHRGHSVRLIFLIFAVASSGICSKSSQTVRWYVRIYLWCVLVCTINEDRITIAQFSELFLKYSTLYDHAIPMCQNVNSFLTINMLTQVMLQTDGWPHNTLLEGPVA